MTGRSRGALTTGRVADPDPVFKFLWIRFQPGLLEENLKIMTKDRQK